MFLKPSVIAFRRLRERIGLSLIDIAMITGHSPRAVSYWLEGKRPVPFHVVMILRAYEEGFLERQWIEAEAEEFETKKTPRKAGSVKGSEEAIPRC
jgi:transcriptional regulator with XRE-family HTH domain